MSIAHLLNLTVEVYRPQRSPYRGGGYNKSETLVGSVAARIRPTSSTQKPIAYQGGADLSHVMYTQSGEDIQRGDIIRWEGREAEVIAVREPSKRGHHLEIDITERVKS